MDIWITRCKRRATCHYCEQYIESGSPMVKGKLWKKSDATATKWSFYFYWHPECWLKQGLESLEQRPQQTVKVGRPRLPLGADERKARLKLLRDYARLKSRLIEQFCNNGTAVNTETVTSIAAKMREIAASIEAVGGVPRSWRAGEEIQDW